MAERRRRRESVTTDRRRAGVGECERERAILNFGDRAPGDETGLGDSIW